MKVLLLTFVLLVAVSPVFILSQDAYGQAASSIIGSESVIYNFGNVMLLNTTSFEIKISSNSSFIVSTVLIATNSSSASPSVSIREWKIYDSTGGEPFIYNDFGDPLRVSSNNEVRAIAGPDILPLGVPENGSLGVKLDASGMQRGDQVLVTFVYMTNAGSMVSTEILPATQLPFYVSDNLQIEKDTINLDIDDSFVNPEIHCEICTFVDTSGQSSVAYTTNATDLANATKFVFWAMGENGGESVTFRVAGKVGQNNTVTYANSTSITLDSDWKRYEVDLAEGDLQGITHLFRLEVEEDEKFYIKGATYY